MFAGPVEGVLRPHSMNGGGRATPCKRRVWMYFIGRKSHYGDGNLSSRPAESRQETTM